MGAAGGSPLRRYEVNVFVAHDSDGGAPVVLETNPTYPNLFGRIEHQGVLGGGFITDHHMLRPGAVHRANGGYLMLPAAEVLSQPLVWLKLKDILRTGQIRLENPAEEYALIPTSTLTPETIELDLKVILVGRPPLYELAYGLDEDVRKLFRVKAEFDWRVPWDAQSVSGYAGVISLDRPRLQACASSTPEAVARVIEHGARLAESRDHLSTSFADITGLATEASHWAAEAGSECVSAEHVEQAVEHQHPSLEPDRGASARAGRRGRAAARLRRRARGAGQRARRAQPRGLQRSAARCGSPRPPAQGGARC